MGLSNSSNNGSNSKQSGGGSSAPLPSSGSAKVQADVQKKVANTHTNNGKK